MKLIPAVLLLTFSGFAMAEISLLDEKAGIPQAPFDDTRYTLGFDIYVAGRNLPAAWQVARKAVSLKPEDAPWLKRYAQVSEWVGEPAEALSAWLRHARLTGADESWNAVARLAPMLLDDEALLAYQQRLATQRPADLPTLLKLADIYERLGRPQDGLRFLKGLESGKSRAAVLEVEALLAERSGQDAEAITALDRLLAVPKPKEAWLLRRAALQYRRGDLPRAQAGLAAVEKQMPSAATGYWQTYAELSRLLNLTETAQRAYQVLMDGNTYSEGDLWNYAALIQEQDPLAAASLQELLFRRFARDNGAINALSLWQVARAWSAADAFLASLTPEAVTRLEANGGFLEQRARLAWVRGRLADARRDYVRGLQLTPDSVRLVQGLAGVLLEQDDTLALRYLLETREGLARRHEPLWPAWASGWQRLRQLSRALPYQLAWQRRHPEDALAALALADTLDAQGQLAQARQLRQAVLARAGAHLDAERPERRRQLEDALLALKLQQARPGPGRRLLQDRLGGGKPDSFSRDLSLSWLLNHDAADAALNLAARTPDLRLPGWAALGFALPVEDRPAMDKLINQRLEELPIYDRLEAAERLGRHDLAVDLAFRTLETEAPDDDELHRRFVRLGGAHGHRLSVQALDARQGGLDYAGTALQWEAPLGDGNRLALTLHQENPSRKDAAALGRDPDNRRLLSLQLSHPSARSLWLAGLQQSEGLARNTGLLLAQTYTVDSRLRLDWALHTGALTADSLPLRVAGLDDKLAAGFNWTPDGRHHLNLRLEQHDYRAQTGESLGSGRTLLLEAGHRLFAGQSDHMLKMQLGEGRFSADATPLSPVLATLVPAGAAADSRFFVPQDYRQLALAWAFGQIPEDQPVRGWRGFGELGANYSDNGGAGYQSLLGVQGPLLGGDRLRLQLQAGRSGQSQGNSTGELRLDYRIFY